MTICSKPGKLHISQWIRRDLSKDEGTQLLNAGPHGGRCVVDLVESLGPECFFLLNASECWKADIPNSGSPRIS